jgi:hypothetical protein
MGRVMRGHEGKEFAIWLDHSGNYLRFRDDWDQVFEEGVEVLDDGKEKPKKEPKVKREPSAYNLFIKGALAEIKAELASKPDAAKPDQKEIMKLAALKWNEHKAAASKA